MLEKLSDKTIETLLMTAKKNRALRRFFADPKEMIRLRQEAARRGIYATEIERLIVERRVYDAMGDGGAK